MTYLHLHNNKMTDHLGSYGQHLSGKKIIYVKGFQKPVKTQVLQYECVQ